MFIRRPPQWLRPQKRKAAELRWKERRNNETNGQSENSPRLCLLALESLRTSLWPMELRKIIVSATSPSCIVPVAFQAMQGPPLQPDGTGGGVPPSSMGQVDPSDAGTDLSSLSQHFSLCLSVCPSPLCVFFRLLLFSASLSSGVWCCDCTSKQARGTRSHHAAGGASKGREQRGRSRGCEVYEEEACWSSPGSTHEAWEELVSKQGPCWSFQVCCKWEPSTMKRRPLEHWLVASQHKVETDFWF